VKLRELAVPLQAFMAMTFCIGLVWMIYAVAFFDATPPSALEVRALVTQDVQINDLRTAAAMTVDALFGFGPTQILLPTYTFTPTLTPTSTLVSFSTVATTPTATSVVIFGGTPTEKNDSQPNVPTRTLTPRPPTVTASNIPPTITSVPVTQTPMPPTATTQPPPTATDAPPPTATDVPPTDPPTTDPPTAAPTSGAVP
jgi:hypothetical protein